MLTTIIKCMHEYKDITHDISANHMDACTTSNEMYNCNNSTQGEPQ